MREVAADVWLLDGYPLNALNVYLAEDIVIDAGMHGSYRLLRQLRGQKVSLMALTHCHPDHQGIAAQVCKQFGVPLACHEADVAAMEDREPMYPVTGYSNSVIGPGRGRPILSGKCCTMVTVSAISASSTLPAIRLVTLSIFETRTASPSSAMW